MLRKAAALGFAGIYVREDVGGAGLSRLDAALVFEELRPPARPTAAYISIHNMVGLDDRPVRPSGRARRAGCRAASPWS